MKTSTRGQSLIELLIAMGVSVVIFGAALQLFVTSFIISTRSRDIQSATPVAQDTLSAVQTLAAQDWFAVAGLDRDTPYSFDESGVPQLGTTTVIRGDRTFSTYFQVQDIFRIREDGPPGFSVDFSTLAITALASWRMGGGSVTFGHYVTSHDVDVFHETWPNNGTIWLGEWENATSSHGYLWSGHEGLPSNLCLVNGVLRLANAETASCDAPYAESGFLDSEDIPFVSSFTDPLRGPGFLYTVWYGARPDGTTIGLDATTDGITWVSVPLSDVSGVPAGVGLNFDAPMIRFRLTLTASEDGGATPLISSLLINWVRGSAPGDGSGPSSGFGSIEGILVP